jgi:hypothetical protein
LLLLYFTADTGMMIFVLTAGAWYLVAFVFVTVVVIFIVVVVVFGLVAEFVFVLSGTILQLVVVLYLCVI